MAISSLKAVPNQSSSQCRGSGEENVMNLSPRNLRPAPKVRPSVELLEGRDMPSALLYPDMTIVQPGPGGGVIGRLYPGAETPFHHGFIVGTHFQGQMWDAQFKNGMGGQFGISGDLTRSLLILPMHPTPMGAAFAGSISQGGETESVKFAGTFDTNTQTMTGTLDRFYSELAYNPKTHSLSFYHWSAEAHLLIVPQIPQ
jgi:hypothetical protein